ncbi:MAG TPA: hypothetical protein VF266_23355 [Thermoanaerobaculia bacterium]
MSRYPGTRPFSDSPDDVARFFGRDAEAEELYLRVLSVPLLVQFGNSGLGKTSLLQAGLFPRLRQKPFLPVMIRLNNVDESLTAAVERAIRESCASEGIEPSYRSTEGLWELLSSLTVWRDDLLLTPVLVFDQFEEVFTLRDAAFRAEIASELGALASGIPPARAAGTRRPMVKVLISLREDYLGALEEFSAAIPGLFQERLRLAPLTEENARDAITGPARIPPPFEFEPAALDLMIDELQGKSGIIEPFQLQLLARHAETIAERKGGGRLTVDDFRGTHDFESVLKNFYRGTLQSVAQRSKAQRLIEEGLLGASGHRLMLEERQIRSDYGVTPETLRALENSRLIRRERRLESVFYEISHDRLADSIFRNRTRRLPRSVRLALWAAALVAITVVTGLIVFNQRVAHERDTAEGWMSVLLGEEFFGALRDSGRSTVSKRLQDQIVKQSEANVGSAFTRGLALRNHGDLQRIEGTLAEALTSFRAALAELEKAPDAVREVARTNDRIGEALEQQGDLDGSLHHFGTAARQWRAVVRKPSPLVNDDCAALAESLIAIAALHVRTGNTPAARRAKDEAFGIVFGMLFDTPDRCGTRNTTVHRDPDVRALRVLSMIALVQNALEPRPEAVEGATEMASRARALQPMSIRATSLELTALMTRGAQRTAADKGLRDYRHVLGDLRALQRWDPDNRSWQRDGAVVQVLIAQALSDCVGCATEVLDEAELTVSDALVTLRALRAADPGNLSLHDHLVWALRVYGKVLAHRGLPFKAAALARFDEAERLCTTRRHAANDVWGAAEIGRVLLDKASALVWLQDVRGAIAAADRAATLLAPLAERNPQFVAEVASARMLASHFRAQLERTAGGEDLREAMLVQQRVAASYAASEDAATKAYVRAVEQKAKGSSLYATDPAGDLRHQRAAQATLRDAYLRVRPVHADGYVQMIETYLAMYWAHQKLGNADEELRSMAAAMTAAEMARWLTTTPQERKDAIDAVVATHYKLSEGLVAQGRYAEALDVLQDLLLLGPELLAEPTPDGAALAILGEAKCGAATIQRKLGQPGWEDTLRGGLIYLRRAAALDRTQQRKLDHWTAYASEGAATTAASRPSGNTRP